MRYAAQEEAIVNKFIFNFISLKVRIVAVKFTEQLVDFGLDGFH